MTGIDSTGGSLMDAYRILVLVHAGFGTLAMLSYWNAAFSRKGSPWHKLAGRIYVKSMLGIIATALPIAAVAFARGKTGQGIFLSYLVVITATALWLGWRAIRRKTDQAGFRDRSYLVVALLNLTGALLVFLIGRHTGNAVLIGFAAISAYGGTTMLRRYRHPLDSPRWWLREHFAAMLACGVATHIAFLSIGLNRLLQSAGIQPSESLDWLSWFAPVLVALLAGVYFNRKYFPHKPAAARAE